MISVSASGRDSGIFFAIPAFYKRNKFVLFDRAGSRFT